MFLRTSGEQSMTLSIANFSIISIAAIAFALISRKSPGYARTRVSMACECVEIFTLRNKNVNRYWPCISTFFEAELAVTSCTYVPIKSRMKTSVSYGRAFEARVSL